MQMARRSMREVLFGSVKTRAVQHQAIERLLATPLHELRYTRLEDAIRLLRGLVEGQR
jgi:hypothetical protein